MKRKSEPAPQPERAELERELESLRGDIRKLQIERDLLKKATVGSTGQGNILSMLALGVGNGAIRTAWTVDSSEEGIMAAMERRPIAD